jgi:transcriptional regulator with XRE-family HTH domain
MTIEGLGKKFQEARLARNLTLDEAARMTKIRPHRLAEIEADDFSKFPSLAYAKGFLLIYGKFLDVDVTPYLDAFEDSESVTVDGYSYLQENERAKPVSAPVVRRRPVATGGSNRVSQCAAARAWTRGLERANVTNCDAGGCLGRVEPGSSSKHWRCRDECAGRVPCPDTRAAGNAQGFGC